MPPQRSHTRTGVAYETSLRTLSGKRGLAAPTDRPRRFTVLLLARSVVVDGVEAPLTDALQLVDATVLEGDS